MSLKRGRVSLTRAGEEASKAAALSRTQSSEGSQEAASSIRLDSDAANAATLAGRLQDFAQEAKVAVAHPQHVPPTASSLFKHMILIIHLIRNLLIHAGDTWTDGEEAAFPAGLKELPLLAYRMQCMASKLFYGKGWRPPTVDGFQIDQSLGWVMNKFKDTRDKLLARIKASAVQEDPANLKETDKTKAKGEEEDERVEPPTKRARSSSPPPAVSSFPSTPPPVSVPNFVPLTLEAVRRFCDEVASASSDALPESSDEIDSH